MHRRSIVIESWDEEDEIRVLASFLDERPSAQPPRPQVVHRMNLEVTVAKSDRMITSSAATMDQFPHTECPEIVDAFGALVGLRVGGGFNRAVRDRFGGVAGCAHLVHLTLALGPAIVQSFISLRSATAGEAHLAGEEHPAGAGPAEGRPSTDGSAMVGTCHVWAVDGPALRKLEAGWQPGRGAYPALPVSDYVSRP